MKVTKGKIKVDRFLVPYRIYGQGCQFIVCVNGAQQTMAAWRSVVSFFSKDYRLLLFDMPGQGRAQILSGSADVTVDEQVQVVQQILLRQSAPGKSIMVGASWGGIVVAVFASRFPHLIDKIILASFGIRASEKLLMVIRKGIQLYENGQEHKVADLIIKNFGQHLSDAYKKRVYDQFSSINKEQFQTFYEHGKLLISSQHINEVVDLRSIKAQTLIINGANDTIMNLKDIKKASAQIPNCEVRLIPGVGHFLHNECEDVLRIYKDFLSSPSLSGAEVVPV
ncbi:MAG: alpha/beta fold hydrolase [Candidatus Binatia bacterium]